MSEEHNNKKLNDLLNHLPTPAPASEDFINRILDAATPRTSSYAATPSTTQFSWRDMLAPVSGLVLACTLGVMMGLSSLGRTSEDLLSLDAGDYIAGSTPLIEDLENLK